MLIKKLIGICKKSGIIMLCETDGEGQWLGTGAAMYPLFDLPEFDRHTICRTYDISEKQAEKIIFRHEPELPESFCFSDIDESESLCDPIEMEITVKGQSVQPYMTSQGIAFIDRKYLQPLEDGDMSMLEIYERTNSDGQMYFAAKIGFMLVGILTPANVVNQKFVDMLHCLYVRTQVMVDRKGGEVK